ncbi:MAG TPA: hypothetical protein VNP92_10295 [Actinophytocola sp.]|nr:hypothetical protein [Actinophytocola sp.]
MLQVELDIFSGMPNPEWTLSADEERELLERVRTDPAQLSPVTTEEEQFSLGYRGLIVRQTKQDDGAWSTARLASDRALPTAFRVGSRAAAQDSIAGWLLENEQAGLEDEVRAAVGEGVALVQSSWQVTDPAQAVDEKPEGDGADAPDGTPPPGELTVEGGTWWACGSNYFTANAAYFNEPAHVGLNNCYCFASNHRPDIRYALPGRRGGRPATVMSCADVTAGLYADGWQDGCQPNGLTIVLVIWPGRDYHFYRLVTGTPNWWWGHKPGGTPAKYTDDCGHSLYQQNGQGYAPNNCCRGNYTNFCGYFYQNNSTALVA